MRIKNLLDEDIVNYKKISMFIATCVCDWKCCKELGKDICMCQNSPTAKQKDIQLSDEKIVDRYMKNSLTNAVVIGGLQPFKQYDELQGLIKAFRAQTDDDIIIYTGYNKNEITEQINSLKQYANIIVKYGRFIPDVQGRDDDVLGVHLASYNQYAEKIS